MSTIRLERLENPNTSDGGIDIDSSGNVNIDSGTLFVDAPTNRVGINTTNPNNDLDILKTASGSTTTARIGATAASGANNATFILNNGGTGNSTLRFDYEGSTNQASIGVLASDQKLTFSTAGSTAATIDSSGRLGIGTATPGTTLNVKAAPITSTNYFNHSIASFESDTSDGLAVVRTGSTQIGFKINSGRSLVFGTEGASGAFTEQMRINSTGVLQFQNYNNNDSLWQLSTGYGVSIYGGTNASVQVCRTNDTTVLLNRIGTDGNIVNFYKASNYVGSISVTSSNTSFNTSSDYRLKENIVPVADGIDRLKQLNPRRFNFIIEPSKTVDGFVAHEVQDIVPEAVTGEKDAVEIWKEGDDLPDGVSVGDNKLDDDGNTIPVYQGIDQSKLVPLLTAALQEAIAKIETLEAKVAALESTT